MDADEDETDETLVEQLPQQSQQERQQEREQEREKDIESLRNEFDAHIRHQQDVMQGQFEQMRLALQTATTENAALAALLYTEKAGNAVLTANIQNLSSNQALQHTTQLAEEEDKAQLLARGMRNLTLSLFHKLDSEHEEMYAKIIEARAISLRRTPVEVQEQILRGVMGNRGLYIKR